ncbi:MAG: sterol desaturase family protein [Bacteroidota bacterium]|jgi:alkylglycerol monooxygenase
METYGKILLIAMPIFLLLVLAEKYYGVLRGNDTVRNMDMISSLSSGLTNVTKDVLGLSIVLLSYEWMVQHWALLQIRSAFWMYFAAFVALDFMGYWVHRIQHRVNFFWNAHLVHHSSEEFNLACALRQSISSIVRIFTIFLLPAALLGVPAKVIAVVAPLHLFAQFWYHTRHIGKMGWLEHIIVTPSHHRVHHAINPEYMDKNYSQIFIIWDKLFGTFQEEMETVPPVYGITRPVATWNPIKINFMHVWLLIQDAWRTKSWRDKLRIWFMPTGWRPEDVSKQYPVYKIEDVFHFSKYDTPATTAFSAWIWVQMITLLLLLVYFFGNIAAIGNPGIFLYGGYIFLSVYAYTELMDRNARAWIWEAVRTAYVGIILLQTGDWFGLSGWIPNVAPLLIIYHLLSVFISYRFSVQTDGKQKAFANRAS